MSKILTGLITIFLTLLLSWGISILVIWGIWALLGLLIDLPSYSVGIGTIIWGILFLIKALMK